MISNPVNVRDLIDRSPIRTLQYWTFATCILIAVMDGYDTAVVGVAAPALIKQGLVDARSFGYIASAGLAGFVPGMLVFGPAADRWGRKLALAVAVVIFAAGSLVTGLSEGLPTLLMSRFITGIGVGGAAPCFVALAADYAPQRARTTVVTVLWAGVPFGGVLGGLVAARFLDSAGWPALFYLGAVAPVAAVGLLVTTVPESIGYLAARGGQDERIRSVVRRIVIDPTGLDHATFVMPQAELVRRSVKSVFENGQARVTLPLWLAFFCSFGQLVMITQYSAVLLREIGMPSAQISTVFSFLFVGSVFGTMSAGPVMKRMSHTKAAAALLVVAAAGSVLFGFMADQFMSALIGITVAGFTASAAIGALVALATELYPISVRATGVGWSLAAGRFGSAVTPLFSGLLVSRGLTQSSYYAVVGCVALLGAGAVLYIHLLKSRLTAEIRAPLVVGPLS